jgi:hypothetical protein
MRTARPINTRCSLTTFRKAEDDVINDRQPTPTPFRQVNTGRLLKSNRTMLAHASVVKTRIAEHAAEQPVAADGAMRRR